jgi:hypothetical protein
MRSGSLLVLVAGLMAPVEAFPQEWQVYAYPDAGFSIQFPATPTVEMGTAKTAGGATLPLTRYIVRQDRIVYSLEVLDYSGTAADATRTIAEAEKTLSATGQVTVAIDARVNRSFGREMSINGPDGSRSVVALFFVNQHLYTLVGRSLPPNAIQRSGDAIRFQESLQFNGANGFGGFGGFGGPGAPGAGPGGRFRGGNPQAVAACKGKSDGDTVQLDGPGGPVAAICTLVARPIAPPGSPPGAPPGP